MQKIHLPWITIGVSATMIFLFFLPSSIQSAFYLEVDSNSYQSLTGWITGHFIHADHEHLAWNIIALLALGSILEVRSKALLLASLGTGIIAVDALLLSPLSTLQYYCGLSGVLNTLLGATLWVLWTETRSKWIIALAIASIIKMLFELLLNQSLLTNVSWLPYPLSHLAGFISTPLVILWVHKKAQLLEVTQIPSPPRTI